MSASVLAASDVRAPCVSVVIPTYNRARDIERCLDSLVRQTFKDFEVLVCDDGSTDHTARIVEKFASRLSLQYRWAENFGGPARPRNIGLRLARGEYVAFLDSDDWWLPRKLEVSVAYLQRGADVVYHDLYLVKQPTQKVFLQKSGSRVLSNPAFDDMIANGPALNNSSVVARRRVLNAIGGFAEERELIAAEDYDAWLRAGSVTDAFVRIPQTLGCYWVGGGNLSNPRRTLRNLDALENRYAKELNDPGRRDRIYWLEYVKARSHFLLGSYEQAKAALTIVCARRAPLSIRIKSRWMLLSMRMRKA